MTDYSSVIRTVATTGSSADGGSTDCTPGLDVSLFPHQHNSITRMETLEREKIVRRRGGRDFVSTSLGFFTDPPGSGKCLAYDTEVVMYNGCLRRVQDIVVGDQLMGDDSLPRTVSSISRGRERLYKIVQENGGESYTVNESHILSLLVRETKSIDPVPGPGPVSVSVSVPVSVSTSCDDETGSSRAERVQHWAVTYFQPKLLIFSKKTFTNKALAHKFYQNLDIDPRVDISLRQYLYLADDVRNRLYGYRTAISFSPQWVDDDPYQVGHSQHIPLSYIANTYEVRRATLAGALDSVEQTHPNEWRIRSDDLRKTVVFLARSLGVNVTVEGDLVRMRFESTSRIPVRRSLISRDLNATNYCRIDVVPLARDQYYGFTIDRNRRFLLADCTVTHNTMSMVSLIQRDRMAWDLDTPFVQELVNTSPCNLLTVHTRETYHRIACTLVVVSSSVLHHWVSEFAHARHLRVRTVTSRRCVENIEPDQCDVVIVLTSMYNAYTSAFARIAWKRLVIDQPENERITNMKDTVAGFTWIITDPESLISRYYSCKTGFIRKLLLSVYGMDRFETYFEGMIVRNHSSDLLDSFDVLPVHRVDHECRDSIVAIVHGAASPDIISMLKAGSIERAMQYLGGKCTDNLVELVRNKLVDELSAMVPEEADYTEKKLRLECRIADLESRFNEALAGSCAICLDKIIFPVLEPNCQNLFCADCLVKWLTKSSKCPLCKTEIESSDLVYLKESSHAVASRHYERYHVPTKLEKILDLIHEKPQGKFIIYSAYAETFHPIYRFLLDNDITVECVTGKHTARTRKIEAFNSGLTKVMFLTPGRTASGVNLQEATDIVFYHDDLCNHVQQDIISTANRIGRTTDLTVHYLRIRV